MLDLYKNANGQGWLRPYQSELSEEYAAFINFEAEALTERTYESLFIPGLLQTADYAQAVIAGSGPTMTQAAVGRGVQARLERQERLAGDSPLELWAIVDEAAIRRQVGGPTVMRDQLKHLLDMTAEPHINLQVTPYNVGAHPGMFGSFIHLTFTNPADPDLIYVDTLTGELFLEAEDDLRTYSSMFDHLRASALSLTKTKSMLSTVRESLMER